MLYASLMCQLVHSLEDIYASDNEPDEAEESEECLEPGDDGQLHEHDQAAEAALDPGQQGQPSDETQEAGDQRQGAGDYLDRREGEGVMVG